MTAPRRVLPGVSYLFTRRCSERRFFLRPSEKVNQIFLYALGLAAERFGVRVHAYCAMSNHVHLVVTDPEARLPAFAQLLDALVARAVNATIGHWEALWSPGSYSAVMLVQPADVLEKSAYTLANPVAAGLVPRGRAWPGARSAPEAVGGPPIRVERPADFFDEGGELPDFVELQLSAPPGFSAERFRDELAAATAARERRAGAELACTGRRFLGARAVLAQDPYQRPSERAQREEPKRDVDPRIACRNKQRRKEQIRLLEAFLGAYRRARRAFRDGARRTVFPFGTYGPRVFAGVRCASR